MVASRTLLAATAPVLSSSSWTVTRRFGATCRSPALLSRTRNLGAHEERLLPGRASV